MNANNHQEAAQVNLKPKTKREILEDNLILARDDLQAKRAYYLMLNETNNLLPGFKGVLKKELATIELTVNKLEDEYIEIANLRTQPTIADLDRARRENRRRSREDQHVERRVRPRNLSNDF